MANPVPVSYSAPAGAVISAGRTAPRIVTGTYTGTGAANAVTLGWAPELVIIKSAGKRAVYHGPLGWHGRSNYLTDLDSDYLVTLTATGFSMTTHADVNADGVEYHYIAITENGTGVVAQTAWIGNVTDNREIEIANRAINLLFVKRDNQLPAALRHECMSTDSSILTTGGSGAYIRSTAHGTATISAATHVNQNDGPATVGEGLEGIAFCESPHCRLVQWVGNGTTVRGIAGGFAPCAALLVRDDGSAPLPEIITDTMPAGTSAPLSTAANNTGRVSLSATGLTLDDTTWNASGVSYAVLLLRPSDAIVAAPAPVASGKYVELSGSSSSIQFGENALLDVGGGPFSLEWYGRRMTSGACIPLWMRGNGTISGTKSANSGEYSWGLFIYPPVDPYSHGWVGDVFRVVHTNYLAGPLVTGEVNTNWYSWNTGVIAPLNEDMHLLLTHDGSGFWRLYLNGVCIKQREMDMTTVQWGERSNAGTGAHDAIIGARLTAADVLADSRQMRVYLNRIYSRELSADDVRRRYARAVLGQSVPDVTPLEEWAYTDGSGTTLSATNNSANDAVIAGGTWGDR